MISITKTQSIFKHMFVIIVANLGHKKSQALLYIYRAQD